MDNHSNNFNTYQNHLEHSSHRFLMQKVQNLIIAESIKTIAKCLIQILVVTQFKLRMMLYLMDSHKTNVDKAVMPHSNTNLRKKNFQLDK